MALKIRLSRIGTKHNPVYRVVVAEQRSRRDGDATEILGTYTPEAKGNPLQIKLDRVDYWFSKGARTSAWRLPREDSGRHSAGSSRRRACWERTRSSPSS
jgi:small subunit ribosomal protein S16